MDMQGLRCRSFPVVKPLLSFSRLLPLDSQVLVLGSVAALASSNPDSQIS
jgi:hypothetical protein